MFASCKFSENNLTSIIIIITYTYIIMILISMARNICLQKEIRMCFVLRKTTSFKRFCQHIEDLFHLNSPKIEYEN